MGGGGGGGGDCGAAGASMTGAGLGSWISGLRLRGLAQYLTRRRLPWRRTILVRRVSGLRQRFRARFARLAEEAVAM